MVLAQWEVALGSNMGNCTGFRIKIFLMAELQGFPVWFLRKPKSLRREPGDLRRLPILENWVVILWENPEGMEPNCEGPDVSNQGTGP